MTCIDIERTAELMVAQASPCKAAIRLSAEMFDFPQKAVIGPRRTQPLVWARFMAMWAASYAGVTYPQIGRAFGDRDHTSVMHAVQRAAELQQQNPVLKAMGEQMLERMGIEQ